MRVRAIDQPINCGVPAKEMLRLSRSVRQSNPRLGAASPNKGPLYPVLRPVLSYIIGSGAHPAPP